MEKTDAVVKDKPCAGHSTSRKSAIDDDDDDDDNFI